MIRIKSPPRAAAVAALLAGTALGGLAPPRPALAQEAGAIQPTPPQQRLPDFRQIVAQVEPAVVSVTNVLKPDAAQADDEEQGQGFGQGGGPFGQRQMPFPFPFPFGMTPHQPAGHVEARGSGFFVDADGTLVTNNHVVKGARSISVTLDDGTKLAAKVIGTDPGTDLAVLKVDAKRKLPFLQLGDSGNVEPGEWVLAIGNPYGLSGSVTAGIVSARGRDIGDGPYNSSFIQVDAPINRGNSGGPLLTQDGRVVGVNTAILSPSGGSIGIGFAIPSDTVRNVVAQIEKSGHVTRGYIGVSVQQVTPEIAKAIKLGKPEGALVASTAPDGPAAGAGLQPGDVVQSVNGNAVKDPRALAQTISQLAPGAEANLQLWRDGGSKSVTVTVADQAQAETKGSAEGIGVALAALTPQARQQFDVPEQVHGAVIARVRPGSAAEQAGLQPGDVILGVGDANVRDPGQASTAIREALKASGTVALRVLRDGQAEYVAITPAPAEENGAG